MLCVHCATPIPEDSRFCLNCGSQVSDPGMQQRASAAIDASSTARMERILREDTKGEFVIERQLGKGGMAAVYLATEVRLGRKVAIKVLPPELTFGHGVERFVREAKTAAALDHPHIIPIYRITSGDTIFWYAMKYLEGRSLDDVVKERGMFSVEETVSILGQVADALEYAHQKQVIHRDVKPANVMLDAQGRVVVTDFGIAKALTEGTLTASGAAVGTPYYMSPEQAKGGVISGAADQYSLGVVAYRMLSGQLPFEGDSAVEIVHQHCHDDPPPLDVLRPGLPSHVYAAVARSLKKQPADRFPTIMDFIRGLQGQGEATLTEAPAAARRISKTRAVRAVGTVGTVGVAGAVRRRVPRAVVVSAAVVVVAAAAVGGWLVVRGRVAGAPRPEGAAAPAAPAAPGATGTLAGPASPATRDTGKVAPAADTVVRRPVAATSAVPAGSAASGRLTIVAMPRGGRVTVDDRSRSGTSFTLREGQHVVRLEAAGFEPVVETVRIRAGATARVTFTARPVQVAPPVAAKPAPAPPPTAAPESPPAEPAPNPLGSRGVLLLNVEPWAAIAVDGVARGQSRTLVDTLRAGPHMITLSRQGYAQVDTTVAIRAGEPHRVVVRMRASP